ncbi:sulfotransferase family protein [Planctomicrobium sp. SH664]|uniref:sulfotransferase family protein n=1 Tax=Planctomicrobium sp. SH664 TaxID=3448125 RepID=UPI003F5BADB7
MASVITTTDQSRNPPSASPVAPVGAKVSDGTQLGLTAFHGLDIPGLIRFLSLRPPLDRHHWGKIASFFFTAPWNSFANLVETLVQGRRVERTELTAPPVFVLGHWRSGTTLLQSLLALDPQFVTPNLAEVFWPGSFLTFAPILSPLTARFLPETRPMDSVPVGWEEPQEDEIALLIMCLYSPYLMLAFHERREKFERYFDVREMQPHEERRWEQSFRHYLKKLTLKWNRRVLLKSPTHTFRVPKLVEMFPDAKFVYIYRDPYAVFNSSVHLRKTMFRENTLSNVDHSHTPEEVLHLYMRCFHLYEEARPLIPAGNLYEIRYEDLDADPLNSLGDLYRKLSLPGWNHLEPLLRARMSTIKEYKKNRFDMDPELMRMVYERTRPAFERFGYPSRLDESPSVRSPAAC